MSKPTYEELEKRVKELEKAEAERKQAEKKYNSLLEAVTSYVYYVTVKNGTAIKTIHGPRCIGVTGYTTDDYQNDPYLWINIVHEEDRDHISEQISLVLAGKDTAPIEHRLYHKNGSVIWVRSRIVSHYDDKRQLISYDGIIEDITERKNVEEALRQSEELLNATQKLTKVGGWQWDIINQTMFWTDETYRIHGFDANNTEEGFAELIERSVECYGETDRPIIMEAFNKCVTEGK